MTIGYIKQTRKQSIEEQTKLLLAINCTKIYTEASNNIGYSKSKLDDVIKQLKEEDTLVITKLSVLAISIQQLLSLLIQLVDKGIVVKAINDNFSSSNQYSLIQQLRYIANFISDIKYEKQAIGIQKAREKGKRLGRKPKMSTLAVQKAINLKKVNTSTQVANRFGIGKSTLLRHIAKYKSVNVAKTKKAG